MPDAHVPHEPPQPLGPQVLPVQLGVHAQVPAPVHVPKSHVPHEPPQPLGPQVLPAQLGTQASLPASAPPLEEVVPEEDVVPDDVAPEDDVVPEDDVAPEELPDELVEEDDEDPEEASSPGSPDSLPLVDDVVVLAPQATANRTRKRQESRRFMVRPRIREAGPHPSPHATRAIDASTPHGCRLHVPSRGPFVARSRGQRSSASAPAHT